MRVFFISFFLGLCFCFDFPQPRERTHSQTEKPKQNKNQNQNKQTNERSANDIKVRGYYTFVRLFSIDNNKRIKNSRNKKNRRR